MERLQGSHSVLGWNDSRESFCPRMERLQGSHSVLGWNDSRGVNPSKGQKDSRGVILSWDGTTPGESFCPEIERLQGSHSVLG